MTREERAAYMRRYRAEHPQHKKRDPNLDRSRPPNSLWKTDYTEFMKRKMRWWRAKTTKAQAALDNTPGPT